MLQITSQFPKLPGRGLYLRRHKCVGFFGPRDQWATCRQRGWFAWERVYQVSGFGLPGSSAEVSSVRATHTLGTLPQHSRIFGCTPASSGSRKCRGREAGRACFPSVFSGCAHLAGWAGLQWTLWESGTQGGQPGWWETQDWSQGSTRGRGGG